MKSEELFALAVRIIGLVLLCYGVRDLVDSGLFKLGYFTLLESSPGYYLIVGLFSSAAGIYLMRGAPLIVEFAYRASEEDEADGDDGADDDSQVAG